MDKKLKIVALAFVVLLPACQYELWDGDQDGIKDDLSYWWPNAAEKVVVECLSVPGKDISMVRGSFIETGPDKEKVFQNHRYNYLTALSVNGCVEKTSVKTFWKPDVDTRMESKYVAVEYKTRYRFKIGSSIGFIFSQAEKACFNDSSQHPDLIQRAIDCNFDRENDVVGLQHQFKTSIYQCLPLTEETWARQMTGEVGGQTILTPLCEKPRRIRRENQVNSGCSFASIADNSCGYSTPEVSLVNF